MLLLYKPVRPAELLPMGESVLLDNNALWKNERELDGLTHVSIVKLKTRYVWQLSVCLPAAAAALH